MKIINTMENKENENLIPIMSDHVCNKAKSYQKSDPVIQWAMNRYCKECHKLMEANVKITTFEGLLRAFIHNKHDKKSVVGNYKIVEKGTMLVYEGLTRQEAKQGIKACGRDVLVIKLRDGRLLGNASKLLRCGAYRRGDESPAQRVMFDLNVAMIPFNVFEEAKLNIQKAKVVDKGKEEELLLPKLVWSQVNAMLMPLQHIKEDVSKKMPVNDDKRTILRKVQEKNNVRVRDKAGNHKYDKDGNGLWRKEKRWHYTYLDKTVLVKRHFVGAMLLQVGKRQFLFDADRNELPHYRFNPFLVELVKPVKTITEAYESLKPKIVVDALKAKKKVLRQGEWFFIPHKGKVDTKEVEPPKALLNQLDKLAPDLIEYDLSSHDLYMNYDLEGREGNYEPKRLIDIKTSVKQVGKKMKKEYRANWIERMQDYNVQVSKHNKVARRVADLKDKHAVYNWGGELRAGPNRPNRVSKLVIRNGVHYVTGEVEHTGREHEPLQLKGWYVAVPNTSIKSWTITGNID